MDEIHDYERCDKLAWKTRCPARATIIEDNGKQWCINHTPPLPPDIIRATHVLQAAGLITK